MLSFTVKASGGYGKVDVSIFLLVVRKPLGCAEPNNSAFCPKCAGERLPVVAGGEWQELLQVPVTQELVPCILSAPPQTASVLAHNVGATPSLPTTSMVCQLAQERAWH